LRVLALSGSLRSGSLNSELLRLATGSAPDEVEVELWDGLKEIPPYDADDEAAGSAAVEALARAVREADAVLVATPEYNGSIPGVLKNAIDWVSRPEVMQGAFWGKPVAVVSASTGSFGAVWAQTELNKVLKLVGARVVETGLAVARAHERLADPDEELVDDLQRVLKLLGAELPAPVAVAATAFGNARSAVSARRSAEPAGVAHV
jgi:chromate reductase